MTEYSRKDIRDALEWGGDYGRDDGCADDIYDILEQADPRIVAKILKELVDDNWGLALPSNQPSSEPIKKSSEIRDPYDRFSWMNQF